MKADPIWQGHADGGVYDCTSLGSTATYTPETVLIWLATPPAVGQPVDFTALASKALGELAFAQPTLGRYPSGMLAGGTPYTLVNTPTWFWTDPSAWHSLTKREYDGQAWSEVTVSPTALTFTPGDGGAAVSCAGPGTVWNEAAYGPYVPSPSGCDYRYVHSSLKAPRQVVTATYAITWSPTWTSSSGQAGTLAVVTTESTATYAVAEAQTVVVK